MDKKRYNHTERRLAAERLRQARKDAGFPTANHASLFFGWSIKTYLQHEEAIKAFNADIAKIYSKAFKVSSDWLHPKQDIEDV